MDISEICGKKRMWQQILGASCKTTRVSVWGGLYIKHWPIQLGWQNKTGKLPNDCTVIFGQARTCSGFPQNFPRIRIEAPQFCPQENPLKENLPGPENGSRKKLRISLSNHQKLPGIRSPQGFLYKSPMWVKQCHVYHPPVITINLEVVQGGATPAMN